MGNTSTNASSSNSSAPAVAPASPKFARELGRQLNQLAPLPGKTVAESLVDPVWRAANLPLALAATNASLNGTTSQFAADIAKLKQSQAELDRQAALLTAEVERDRAARWNLAPQQGQPANSALLPPAPVEAPVPKAVPVTVRPPAPAATPAPATAGGMEGFLQSFHQGADKGSAWAEKAVADAMRQLNGSGVTNDPAAALQSGAHAANTAATNAANTAVTAIKKGATSAGNMMGKAWDATGDFVGSVANKSENLGKRMGNALVDFGQKLSPTGVITGLLGVGGAFLIGSAFGGSFSWIIGAMLAPMMFLLGNQFGKDSVEPWISSFADGSSKSAPAVGRQRQHEYAPYAAAQVVQQRGFNTTRADNFGQQLVDGGYYPPQPYAYGNGYGNNMGYYPQSYYPPVSVSAFFTSGNGFGYGGNRMWNSYPGNTNGQWQSQGMNGGSQWQSHGSHAPQWHSGGVMPSGHGHGGGGHHR